MRLRNTIIVLVLLLLVGGYSLIILLGSRPVPHGTPRWGSEWKEATVRWYNHAFPLNCHGISYAHRNNYLDLDPTYKDAIGRPLIRMTYNYFDNDYKMSAYLTEKAAGIARAANATIVGDPQPRRGLAGQVGDQRPRSLRSGAGGEHQDRNRRVFVDQRQ